MSVGVVPGDSAALSGSLCDNHSPSVGCFEVGCPVEFFATVDCRTDPLELESLLSIANLNRLCDSINSVLEDRGDSGLVYCLWGEFVVNREVINGGVRFTMPKCPNALSWTITGGHPPAEEGVVVHCTIARTEHEPDFIESLEAFVEDWRQGLSRALCQRGEAAS